MTDLAVRQIDDAGTLDLCVFEGDFIGDDSLRTAVLISVGTDAEYPDAHGGDRRGWWGDALATTPGDRIGGLMWLLARSKATAEVAQSFNEYVDDCLQWIVDDGVARSVSSQLAYDTASRLVGVVQIAQPTGALEILYDGVWAANFSDPFAAGYRLANSWAAIAAKFIQIELQLEQLAAPNGYIQAIAGTAAIFEHIWLDLLPEAHP